jgi:hypothetical protein
MESSYRGSRAGLLGSQLALILASICFGLPAFVPYGNFRATMAASFLASLLWAGIAVRTLLVDRERFVWLLAGSPLALFWPLTIVRAFMNCARGGTCL